MTGHLSREQVAMPLAERRIDTLEAELALALERVGALENENFSLQTSLDLLVSENARLADRLAERERMLKRSTAQLEQLERGLRMEKRLKQFIAAPNTNNERHPSTALRPPMEDPVAKPEPTRRAAIERTTETLLAQTITL